jgi:hypothetical protein
MVAVPPGRTPTGRAVWAGVPVRVAPPAAATGAIPPHQIAPPVTPPLPVEGAPATAVPDDLTILLSNLRE